jgi:hypothetical protein
MKSNKFPKALIVPAIIITVFVTGWQMNSTLQRSSGGKEVNILQPVCATGSGVTSETIFKSDEDNRVWKISNRYSTEVSNDTLMCNNSEYHFTRDSVIVVNEFIGVSRTDSKNLSSTGQNPGRLNMFEGIINNSQQ